MGAEQVLRVARGVVRAAARGDHDVAGSALADPGGDRLGLRASVAQQPPEHLGLLADLRLHQAHQRTSRGAAWIIGFLTPADRVL